MALSNRDLNNLDKSWKDDKIIELPKEEFEVTEIEEKVKEEKPNKRGRKPKTENKND